MVYIPGTGLSIIIATLFALVGTIYAIQARRLMKLEDKSEQVNGRCAVEMARMAAVEVKLDRALQDLAEIKAGVAELKKNG